MKTALKLFPTLVLVAGISVALAFGAKEASACTTCTWEPIPCAGQIDPDLYCNNYCINERQCGPGICKILLDQCLCLS